MEKLILDSPTRAKFESLRRETEVCNEAGQTLGFYIPAAQSQELYGWARAQVTEEELESARRQAGGSSLADILARLEKG